MLCIVRHESDPVKKFFGRRLIPIQDKIVLDIERQRRPRTIGSGRCSIDDLIVHAKSVKLP